MTRFVAQPWWVNLLVLVPPVAYFSWRRNRIPLALRQLIGGVVFAGAFGFVEAVVVVYLRAAVGLLSGYPGTVFDARQSGDFYQQSSGMTQFPQSREDGQLQPPKKL